MKKVLSMPATVTIMPADRRTMTLMRSRSGMFRDQMTGIGRSVHIKSAMQLKMPADMVFTPSSKQDPVVIMSGNRQYF